MATEAKQTIWGRKAAMMKDSPQDTPKNRCRSRGVGRARHLVGRWHPITAG